MRTSALFLVFLLVASQVLTANPSLADQQRQLPRPGAAIDGSRITRDGTAEPQAGATARLTVVPDLSRLNANAAGRLLEKAQLRGGRILWRDSAHPRGTILDQRPPAGTRVPVGSRVDIVASTGVSASGDDVGPPVKQVTVPNLIGRTIEAAGPVIQSSHLQQGRVLPREADRPRGTILEQKPPPGAEVSPRTYVHVMVSSGPGRNDSVVEPERGTLVPGLAGRHIDDLRGILAPSSLSLGDVKSRPSSQPRGIVLEQLPPPRATVSRGTRVHVVVSQGPAILKDVALVPSVIGARVDSATAAIQDARLVPRVDQRVSSNAPTGVVIEQAPSGGSRATPGSPVSLTVSAGEPPVTVPDLVGTDVREAGRRLAGANLRLGALRYRESSAIQPGLVIEQSPAASSSAPRGLSIDVTVASEPPPVVVPDVVGRSEASAGAAIQASRLSLGAVRHEESASIDTGSVISQLPAAGSLALPDTSVELVVSSGRSPLVVPDGSPEIPFAVAPTPPAGGSAGAPALAAAPAAGVAPRPAGPVESRVSPERAAPPLLPVVVPAAAPPPAPLPIAPPAAADSSDASTPPLSHLPWWPLIATAAAALFGARRWRHRIRRADNPPDREVHTEADLTFAPRVDAGRQALALQGQAATSIELAFRWDPGTQDFVDTVTLSHAEASHDYARTDSEGSLRARQRDSHARAS